MGEPTIHGHIDHYAQVHTHMHMWEREEQTPQTHTYIHTEACTQMARSLHSFLSGGDEGPVRSN